jgi:hypothetical protein
MVVSTDSLQDKAEDKYGFAQSNGRVEFEMLLNKGKKEKMEGPNYLVVKRVYKAGLLAKWNERVPQLEVKTGDRIIAVNDQKSAEDMAKEIHAPRIFLQVMRHQTARVISVVVWDIE